MVSSSNALILYLIIQVEAKRALLREEQQACARSGNSSAGRTSGGGAGANMRTNKIFVGVLPPTLTKEAYFITTFGIMEQ